MSSAPVKSSDDIDRELEFHLAERVDDLTAAGATPEAARREARRRLGNYTIQRENVRERDLLVWLESFFADVRYGLRALLKQPVFALTTILTLAIGIGANTTVFSVLHGLLLRSLPVVAPEQLMARIGGVLDTRPGGREWMVDLSACSSGSTSWITHSTACRPGESAAGPRRRGRRDAAVCRRGLRHRQRRSTCSDCTRGSGVCSRRGDDVAGGPPEAWPVVLSDRYWRERFDADRIGAWQDDPHLGQPVTVIGVTPRSFHGLWPGFEPRIYLPLHYTRRPVEEGRHQFADVAGGSDRHRPSGSPVSLSPTRGRPDGPRAPPDRRIREGRSSGHQDPAPAVGGIGADRVADDVQGGIFEAAVSDAGARRGGAALVLRERQRPDALEAARASTRVRGRTSIGAGSLRLVRQYLTESALIALAGAVLGAAAAWYGTPLLLPFFRTPMQGVGMQMEPDQTVFLVTAITAIVTTLFFGSLPAWRAARANPAGVMKSRSAAQRPTAGRGFVAVQVALSLVLVAMAALLSQSLLRLQNENTGFALDQVTIQTAPFHLLGRQGEVSSISTTA